MFEAHVDQAGGLHELDLELVTRVIPVLATDDSVLSFDWLYQLHNGLQSLGHDVVVIDHLNGLKVEDANLGHQRVLQRWLQGVEPGSVVLLHAPLEAMAVLLNHSQARPLVALEPDQRSAVWAYNAVKVLQQVGELRPLVLTRGNTPAHRAAAQVLQQSCEKHLQLSPPVWWLEYHDHQSRWPDAAQEAFFLKVLDSALMTDIHRDRCHDDPSFERRTPYTGSIVGVPDVHRQRHA
jgi:hypothetical protein